MPAKLSDRISGASSISFVRTSGDTMTGDLVMEVGADPFRQVNLRGASGGVSLYCEANGTGLIGATNSAGLGVGALVRMPVNAGVELYHGASGAKVKKFETTADGVNVVLPTSSAGLSAGDLWNDSGTVKIV